MNDACLKLATDTQPEAAKLTRDLLQLIDDVNHRWDLFHAIKTTPKLLIGAMSAEDRALLKQVPERI